MAAKNSKFITLSRKPVYKGKIFTLEKVVKKAPDGRILQHDIVRHPGAVVIIPLLSEDEFVMIRQYRSALDSVIWEFPAGTLEKGESGLACAKREIIEEIGFEAKKWTKLGSFYPAPGFSTECLTLYIARDLRPKIAEGDLDEFITREMVSLKRLQKMISDGIIIDAKTLVGCFYYNLWKKKQL